LIGNPSTTSSKPPSKRWTKINHQRSGKLAFAAFLWPSRGFSQSSISIAQIPGCDSNWVRVVKIFAE
jgi:hypothetical protein